MMTIHLVAAAILLVASHASAMAQGEPSIYESATPPPAANQLDRIVFANHSETGPNEDSMIDQRASGISVMSRA